MRAWFPARGFDGTEAGDGFVEPLEPNLLYLSWPCGAAVTLPVEAAREMVWRLDEVPGRLVTIEVEGLAESRVWGRVRDGRLLVHGRRSDPHARMAWAEWQALKDALEAIGIGGGRDDDGG